MKKFTLIAVLAVCLGGLQAQKVTEVEGLYYNEQGELYTGQYTSSTEDGHNISTHSISAGQLEGIVVFYHDNGSVQEKGNYTLGKKDGLWESWNEDGVKTGEAFYKNGIKDGVWTIWDDAGVKRYHMTYSMGEKIDVWKMWDENSNLVSEKSYD